MSRPGTGGRGWSRRRLALCCSSGEPATHCIGQGRGRGGGWRTHARSQSASQSETRLRHRLTPKASARHSHRETNGIGRLCVRRLTPAYTIECGMVDARRAVAVIK